MIRPYTPKDKTALINILKQHIPTYFEASEEQDFVNYLDNEIQDYFIVEHNSTIIGSGGINYFPEEKTARLSWDIIHPDMQKQGIGRELSQYRIKLIRSNPSIDVLVVRTTQLVYPFYQKLGFELQKIEKDYWAKDFDLYQLQLRVKN